LLKDYFNARLGVLTIQLRKLEKLLIGFGTPVDFGIKPQSHVPENSEDGTQDLARQVAETTLFGEVPEVIYSERPESIISYQSDRDADAGYCR